MPPLTKTERLLRKNMTKEERKLWYEFLRGLPYTVRRQKVFAAFILDFYCPQAKIAIELDGGQHYEPLCAERDRIRDSVLQEYGIMVLRYPNNAVMQNFSGVCEDILKNITLRVKKDGITSSTASGPPSP